MDERIWDVLDAFGDTEVVTAAELADRLGVTSRTVRTLLSRSRRALADGGARIESKPGTGYTLTITDAEAFADLKETRGAVDGTPVTAVERRRYLLRLLLTAQDYIKLEVIAQALFVSKKTVTADLAQVESILAEHSLLVDRRPYKGVRVIGAELDIRTCLATVYNPERSSGFAVEDLEPGVNRAEHHVREVLDAHDIPASAAVVRSVILHIAIATSRVRAGRTIEGETAGLGRYITEAELGVAGDILDRLERDLGLTYPLQERFYLALHFAGRRVLTCPADASDSQSIVEARQVVDGMLRIVDEGFGLGLSADDELRASLVQHTIPLLVRLRFQMRMPNQSLERIKQAYPLAYAVAVQACTALARHLGGTVSEDEAGYIALWFALALERRRPEQRRKRLVLVSGADGAATRLIELRLRERLGDLIESLITVSTREPIRAQPDTDLVLTTVALETDPGVPVIEVGPFLDDADIRRIRRVLVSEPSTRIDRVFSAELFIPHLEARTAREAIAALTRLARTRYDLPAVFLDSVLRREALAPTDFGNRVAMPHGEVAMSKETFIAVGVLDEPIRWTRNPVQVVCLVSISTREGKDLQQFYQDLSRYLMSEEHITTLIDSRDFTAIVHSIREITQQPQEEV
ncbi:BglG family transcription antiterminator [Actinomyces qiguomingii]|uniref:BglG family transcription antiterminator n=1 Tax=Actinomyces qiguomingii TaxID=2057800 RepID=UPI001304CE59|nr:BglG family transcription antiterminator [Actinomyces qiguomingii]